jgi:hypothetical protein
MAKAKKMRRHFEVLYPVKSTGKGTSVHARDDSTHLEVKVYHSKERKYAMLSVTPVKLEWSEIMGGYVTSFMLMSGLAARVEPMPRLSEKKLSALFDAALDGLAKGAGLAHDVRAKVLADYGLEVTGDRDTLS